MYASFYSVRQGNRAAGTGLATGAGDCESGACGNPLYYPDKICQKYGTQSSGALCATLNPAVNSSKSAPELPMTDHTHPLLIDLMAGHDCATLHGCGIEPQLLELLLDRRDARLPAAGPTFGPARVAASSQPVQTDPAERRPHRAGGAHVRP